MMLNKLIFFLIFFSFGTFAYAESFGDAFDTTTTQGGSWTDPTTGMTYKSFGKKKYRFKRRTTKFTPWSKVKPPSIKAGCGGVSLDGGFASFLNLEEIGDQLETAMSSVGMGVVVALLQTLPSIGKAFENIQKMVRKIQQLLQNACQATATALMSTPQYSKAKNTMQGWLDDAGEDISFAQSKGVDAEKDKLKKATKCDSGDDKCKSATKNLLASTVSKNQYESTCYIFDRDICLKMDRSIDDNGTVYSANIKDFFANKKLRDRVVSVDDIDLTMLKLKYALLGVLVVEKKNSLTSKIDANGKISDEYVLNNMLSGKGKNEINLSLKWSKPLNSAEDFLDFLTGEVVDTNASNSSASSRNSIKISSNLNFVYVESYPSMEKNGTVSSQSFYLAYVEEELKDGREPIELEWNGIYLDTYKTIMNIIDDSHPAPANAIGMFVPKGNEYIKLLKKLSKSRYSSYLNYYVDVLARSNVVYALKSLIGEIAHDAAILKASGDDKATISNYNTNASKVLKKLQDRLIEYPGDVVYLDHLQGIFENIKRDLSIEHAKETNLL
jgi:hypothetical protein